jgi:hypothetical protein
MDGKKQISRKSTNGGDCHLDRARETMALTAGAEYAAPYKKYITFGDTQVIRDFSADSLS